jgi:hypothetical protein
MKHKHLKVWMAALTVAVGLVAAGCILSGEFIFVVEGDGTITSTDTVLDNLHVDLTSNSTWNDHKDDIKSIVDIKFECKFTNNRSDSASGELYISKNLYTTVSDVKDNATLVFSGLGLAGNESRTVSFSESSTYISNLDTVLSLLESGEFYVYGIASDTPFSVTVSGVGTPGSDQEHLRLMVTISAGK